MGISKSDEFSLRDNRIAVIAKALSHPARVAILRFLLEQESCYCGDIVNEMPLSQSTVSQHLKELKSAGLIKGNVDGKSVCYCIDLEAWGKSREIFEAFFNVKPSMKDCC
ncbi:MAG: winged helix-turn-helix transcriptional regulator [Flavobacteriales bacterium]|nr:winged helix-turn-helix transcriptional regulator [Flavobacteriales bacterium]